MDNAAINAQAQQMKNMNRAQVIAEGGLRNTESVLNPLESAIARANSLAQANSARSAAEARELREWQEQQNAKAMAFNASEAAKSRDWQQYMSNTAHQREIADLKAAGLNPVLSAMGGNGAAVTSGATAAGVTSAGAKGEVDTSANQAITNLLGSMIGFMGNLASSSVSAQASMANAEATNEMNKLIALINERSAMNLQKSKEGHDEFMALNYPDNWVEALFALVGSVKDNGNNKGSSKGVLPSYEEAYSSSHQPGTMSMFEHSFIEDGSLAIKAGKALKKIFVDDSSFKKIASFFDKKTREKLQSGYYNSKR